MTYERPRLLRSWSGITAPPKNPSFSEKVVSYGKAEASQMLHGKVSADIFNKRKELCMTCNARVNPKPEEESIGWCKGGCGCAIGSKRAALSEKLYMPNITCPLKKFGPEKGSGFTIESTIDSISGIVTSIQQTINDKDK